MYSSGTSAIATSGAGNVTLITLGGGKAFNRLVIVNEGTAPGFFSVDGGSTWGRIPAATAALPGKVTWKGPRVSTSPIIKRDGATDMTGVYAFADDA